MEFYLFLNKIKKNKYLKNYPIMFQRHTIPVLCNITANIVDDEKNIIFGTIESDKKNIIKDSKLKIDEMQLLSTAIEHTGDSIIIMDMERNIQYVNSFFEKISGYKKTNIINKKFYVLQKEDESCFNSIWEEVLNGKSWKGVCKSVRKDKTVYDEEISISPVLDIKNKIFGFVAIKRDISEKRRLEKIAETTNLMENLGYFFSGIRHELGNPINSIKITLSVLKSNLYEYSKETVLEFINRLTSELLRVEFLLRSLKSFNLYSELELQKTDIDKFLIDFISLIKIDFNKFNIKINYNKIDENIYGNIDIRILHQILLNIMSNSAEAAKEIENPEITIELSKDKYTDFFKITIIDNGCGMDEISMSKLFKPFYTSKSQGTGLGLVIVKKMLLSMSGYIEIESKKDIGTTVKIFIPWGNNEKQESINY